MKRVLRLWIVLLAAGLPTAVSPNEIVNDITQLNPVVMNEVVAPTTIEEIGRIIAEHPGPISIGGGRYSQGGQTAIDGGLQIDMRRFDRILLLDEKNKLITVQAGITWRKVQEAIDPKNLSVKIMQSYSNFTVGGSLSVNVHGRYVGQGAIIRSVRSIRIVLADGSICRASRTENPELLSAAIGGYGGIGVIAEATLELADNKPVERSSRTMPVSKYEKFFLDHVAGSKTAIFHNADLYPPNHSRVNAVTWSLTDKPLTSSERLAPQTALSALDRWLLAWVSEGIGGKAFREALYDRYYYSGESVVWRNHEASYDVMGLEPASRKESTYVLQEYFVPVKKFTEFVPKMREILRRHRVNVLNVSIRHALPDQESLLSWSPTEVFSFVIYYSQGTEEKAKGAVALWTNELIDAAIGLGGAYYLPYQIIASNDQFQRAYPRSAEFLALKRKVDPTYKFRNRLWARYYDGAH